MLKYRFSYRIKLTLLVVVVLPLLIKLGFWQLSRYHEKIALEASLRERLHMPAQTLSEALRYQDPIYLPIQLVGHFDMERYFLLDNQTHQGKAGYDVITPFVTLGGDWLLINRGWLAAEDRSQLPMVNTPSGEVTVHGSLYRLLGKPFLLGNEQWIHKWPKRIQAIDFSRMSDALGSDVPLFTVQLNSNEPGALLVRPKKMKTSAIKHHGYAVQWFAMASVLLGLYLWQMVRGTSSHKSHMSHKKNDHVQDKNNNQKGEKL